MKFKKIAITLGSIAAVAAPITAVVSCGEPASSQYSESDLLKMSNLKSSEAHSKLQDLWLAKVLGNEYGIKNKTPLQILENLSNTGSTTAVASAFENDFKTTLTWVLKNKLFTSKDALSTIYESLKTNAPDVVVNSSETSGIEKHVVKALNTKIFDRKQVHAAVTSVMQGVEWKDLFYNYTTVGNDVTFNPSILGLKDLVLKMMVTKKYLALSANDYKGALSSEYAKLSSKFRDADLIDASKKNFPLVVSVMNSRLAYKTSIVLDATKSREFIVSNGENKLTQSEQNIIFRNATSAASARSGVAKAGSKFLNKMTYTIKSQTRLDEIIAKVPAYGVHVGQDESVGFVGLDTLPSGDDNLNTATASAIKLSKGANSRDGFIVTDKDATNIVNKDVTYTDEDKTKVQLNYYTSLMPVYNNADKTLEFMTATDDDATNDVAMSDEKLDILMNEAYSKDTSLYSAAIKYFTQKDDSIKLEVTNDWARNYYIDEGLTYIKDEDE